MNLLKIILSVAAVFIMSISVPTHRTSAAAAEKKPLDVHLTIETKEIDINEIPDDRIVYLGISIDNAPAFKGLTMYLDKDPRLKFGEPKPFKPAEGAQNIGSINVISYLEIAPDVLGCGVPAKGSKMIDHSGVLIMTELVLPENVRAGDFYYLKFSPYLGSSYMVIDLSIFPEDRYGLESFTQLNNGGIRITEKAQSQPPKPPASTASSSTTKPSSTTSSTPASTTSSSTKSSSTASSTHASTTSSSTTKSSSTTSSTRSSTTSSSTTKSSSTTSSTRSSTTSSSTTKSSSTTSSTPASTVSSSTASSSTTSSVPASTASSSTAVSSSTISSAPASTASSSTAAASSASSISSSAPEAASDNKDEPANKNKFPIIAVLIAIGVIASSSAVVLLIVSKKRKM